MAEALVFATPRTEDMTRVAAGLTGAGITGVIEGVIVKMAPGLGAAAPILTWGTTLGTPLLGAIGALTTRGLIGDLFQGIAAGGIAILGFTLPEMVVPASGRRKSPSGGDVKQLTQGSLAQQRAQQAALKGALVGIDF